MNAKPPHFRLTPWFMLAWLGVSSLSFTSSAAPPNGTFRFDESHPGIAAQPLYDFSGVFTIKEGFQLDEHGSFRSVEFDILLVQDAKGRLHGLGSAWADIKIGFVKVGGFPLFFEAKGKVKVRGKLTYAEFKVTAFGIEDHFRFHSHISVAVDTALNRMVGVDRGKVDTTVFTGERLVQKFDAGAVLDLPLGAPSDWSLNLDLSTQENKVSGLGTIAFSTGRLAQYHVTGNYQPKSGETRLRLKGLRDTEFSGLKLKVALDDASPYILESLQGRVFGQKIKIRP